MSFIQTRPKGVLQHYVDSFWIIEGEKAENFEKIVPNRDAGIIFHLSKPFKRLVDGEITNNYQNFFEGQLTKPLAVKPIDSYKIVGISFHPWSAYNLYPVNMKSLKDRIIPGAELDSELDHVHEQLYKDRKPHQIFGTLAKYVLSKTNLFSPNERRVELAIGKITSMPKQMTLAEICHSVCLSERRIEQLFIEVVGLSPKMYLKKSRFRRVLKKLDEKPVQPLSKIAYEMGYYDQSHFIKEFKAFTGLSPRKYLSEKHSIADYLS